MSLSSRPVDRVLAWHSSGGLAVERETLGQHWSDVQAWLREVADASTEEGFTLALPGGRELTASDWRALANCKNHEQFSALLHSKLGFAAASRERHGLGAEATADFIAAVDDALLDTEGARTNGIVVFPEEVWRQIAREALRYGDDGAQAPRTQVLTRGTASRLPTLGALRLPQTTSPNATPNAREAAIRAIAKDPKAFDALPQHLRDDRYVALALVERDPYGFRRLSAALRDDLAIAREALRNYPQVFADAGPTVRSNPDLILLVLRAKPWLRVHVDVSRLQDARDARRILAVFPQALFAMPAALRNDPTVRKASKLGDDVFAALDLVARLHTPPTAAERAALLKALPRFGNLYRALPEALRADRDLARAAVQGATNIYGLLPAALKALPDIALLAVQQNAALAYPHVPPELATTDAMRRAVLASPGDFIPLTDLPTAWREDPDFLVSYLGNNPRLQIYGELPETLRNDAAFMKRLLSVAPRNYLLFPKTAVTDLRLWADLATSATVAHFFPIAKEIAALRTQDPARFARLKDAYARADILCLERFPDVATLERVLADRQPTPNDPRPLAAIYIGPPDYNGAFTAMTPILRYLVKHYRVVYREPASENAIADSAIADAAQKPIVFSMLGAHGIPSTVALQADPSDAQNLDITDSAALQRARHAFASNAVTIIDACSSGAGGSLSANPANTVSSAWPGTVFGVSMPGTLSGLRLDADGLVNGVRFSEPVYVSRNAEGDFMGVDRAELAKRFESREARFSNGTWDASDIAWLEAAQRTGSVEDLSAEGHYAWVSLLKTAVAATEKSEDWPLLWRLLNLLVLDLPHLLWLALRDDDNPMRDRVEALLRQAKSSYRKLDEL